LYFFIKIDVITLLFKEIYTLMFIILLLILIFVLTIIKSCKFFNKVYQEYHQIDIFETDIQNFPNFYNGK